MKYAKVLHDAWSFASENKKLVWFAFLPSFVAVLTFVTESAWQGFLIFEEFGRIEHGTFFREIGDIVNFISDRGLWGWFIFLAFILFLFGFVFPSLIQSTIILSIRQSFTDPEKKLSLRQKIIEGGKYFFKMFEFHAIVSPFSFLTLIFYFLAFYRYSHGDLSHFFFKILIFIAIFAVFVNLFLAYVPFYLVCEKEELGKSLRKSFGLVFLNIGKTLGLVMIMLLVNLRVLINVVVVFGVPIGLMLIATSYTNSPWYSLIITGAIIAGVLMLGLAAYLTSVLEVFSLGFWERAFTTLRNEQKELEFDENASTEEIETVSAERVETEAKEAEFSYFTSEMAEEPAKISEISEHPTPTQHAEKLKLRQDNDVPMKPETKEDNSSIHFKVD